MSVQHVAEALMLMQTGRHRQQWHSMHDEAARLVACVCLLGTDF